VSPTSLNTRITGRSSWGGRTKGVLEQDSRTAGRREGVSPAGWKKVEPMFL